MRQISGQNIQHEKKKKRTGLGFRDQYSTVRQKNKLKLSWGSRNLIE